MAIGAISRLWALARKLEDLFALHEAFEESLQVIDERLKALESRILKLEAEQTQMITEARSAATAAATAVAGAVLSDAITRITRIEARTDQLEHRRLPPP